MYIIPIDLQYDAVVEELATAAHPKQTKTRGSGIQQHSPPTHTRPHECNEQFDKTN